MSMIRCKGCQGEYEAVQADGLRYFHACPVSIPAEDRRNENPKSTAARDADSVKVEGKGVEAL